MLGEEPDILGCVVAGLTLAEQRSSAPPLDPATLAQLAGGLAHELKNPLSTLSLQLALLREQWQDDPGAKARRAVRILDGLLQQVESLNEILGDFLRFARTDRIELEPASLNQVVQQVAAFAGPEAAACNIGIRSYLDLDLPLLPLDVGRVRQAVLNLLINARQALEHKGGHVSLITRRDGNEAVMEVVDDGPGMALETLQRAFEPYFSTKKSGSGLGLPTVRRILEAHGGRVEVESAPGHGTRVRLRFPIGGAGGHVKMAGDDAQRDPPPGGGGR